MVHTATAAELDIADGDVVSVETPEGRIRQTSRVTDDIIPGVVHADTC